VGWVVRARAGGVEREPVRRPGRELLHLGAESGVHETEQPLQALVQEGAVASLVGLEAHEFELAQGLEAVAVAVDRRAHRHRAELGAARFHVEEEEQAVEVDEAVLGEVGGEVVVEVEDALALLAAVVDGLVREQLDRAPHAVLQVGGDGEGVLVRVLVELVVQAGVVVARERLAVQQRGGGAQRGLLAAAEDLGQVEAQVLPLAPLAPLGEPDLAAGEHQDPARAVLAAEDALVEDLAPGEVTRARARQLGRVREVGRELLGERRRAERIVGVRGGERRFADPQVGPVAAPDLERDRQGLAVEIRRGGRAGVAEGREQVRVEGLGGVEARGEVAAGVLGVGVGGEPALGETGELVERRAGARARVHLGLPTREERREVALEHGLEVVAGVELLVVDAGVVVGHERGPAS